MDFAVAEADAVEQFSCALTAFSFASDHTQHGQFNILSGAHARDQLKRLKYKSDPHCS
jgi:hypothetical protein